MSQVVYRYEFPIQEEPFKLEIPRDFKPVLCEMKRDDKACLWCLIDPKEPIETVDCMVVATGQEVTSLAEHLGSFQMGPYVWHLFKDLR